MKTIAAVVVNDIGQILPYSVQSTRAQTEARMMDIMGAQAWERAKLLGSRVEQCAIVLIDAPSDDPDELALALATESLKRINAHTFTVSANLSDAESLDNFSKFQDMLMHAYRRGASDALASAAANNEVDAFSACSEQQARAVIDNTAVRLLLKV